MFNPFSLNGKTILVTGASSGIGACTSIECSRMGAILVITGRNKDRLLSTYNKLEGNNHKMLPYDLLDVEGYELFVNSLPKIDGVVFSAGITQASPIKRISLKMIDKMFGTNTYPTILLSQSLLKHKKINKGASLVFISSIAVNHAYKGNSIYSASKGALNSFSKVMALELASKQIRVNCIQPGTLMSSMTINSVFTEEQLQNNAALHPLGNGNLEDIANGAIYLLSNASSWVTGTNLVIDGGYTIK